MILQNVKQLWIKTKNSMKKIMNNFVCILIASAILFGCEKDGSTLSTVNGFKIKTYTIDNCEYIGDVRGNDGDYLTHKGNCKFCAERNRKKCQ